jgi:pilus assembly protein Flp/PilA
MNEKTSDSYSDDGASAVEYGLIVVAIAAVIAFVVFILGETVIGQYQVTCDNIATETGSGGC